MQNRHSHSGQTHKRSIGGVAGAKSDKERSHTRDETERVQDRTTRV